MDQKLQAHLEEIGDEEILALVTAVVKAGNRIAGMQGTEEEKGDVYSDFHAIVTEADFTAQEIILETLHNYFPEAYYIAEEEEKGKHSERVLTEKNYLKHLSKHVFIIDSLDGSSTLQRGMYEWSVSVGSMLNKKHQAGAIFAPELDLLIFGKKNKGVYVYEKGNILQARTSDTEKEKSWYAVFGTSVPRFPYVRNIHQEIAARARTVNQVGSCALGLAFIASGKAEALILPTQRIWDFCGGLPLVEEAGGAFLLYHVVDGKTKVVDKLASEDYNPASRRIGFMAGSKHAIKAFKELFDQ